MAAAIAFGLLYGAKSAEAALEGKASLLRAESLLRQRKVSDARAELVRAQQSFTRSGQAAHTLTRYLPGIKAVPLVGSQVKGVEVFAEAGVQLSDAGIRLADAAGAIVEPKNQELELSAALGQLREVQELLRSGIVSLEAAVANVESLDGDHLIRPLGRARTDLARRLPEMKTRAVDADEALASLITFAGGDGPRRYLVLSQNPDEVRPTGGFIGTYGVLEADGGHLSLATYDSIESWTSVHRDAVAEPTERGSPLRFDTRFPQNLANVNTSPDWPQNAALAAKLWQRAGEQPVQGVVSFSPAFLGRILRALGPVSIESYGETVTADNLVERLDFHTHQVAPAPGTERKDFVAVLAQEVMTKLFNAPASSWEPLAQAFGEAFGSREAMAWSTDSEVARVLAKRGWDASVPESEGDFVYPAEFQYAAKNGRRLQRTYDHDVVLRPDGSAQITTRVRIVNADPADPIRNPDGLAYITMYGPAGAQVDPASDPLGIPEVAVAGHPAVGWFKPLAPNLETVVTVVWQAPNVARPRSDGRWDYTLRWLRLPDHTGDTVNLNVELPDGWRWDGAPPPSQYSLDKDLDSQWSLVPAG